MGNFCGVTFRIDTTQLSDPTLHAKLFEIVSFAASLERSQRKNHLEQAVALGLFQNRNGVYTLGEV